MWDINSSHGRNYNEIDASPQSTAPTQHTYSGASLQIKCAALHISSKLFVELQDYSFSQSFSSMSIDVIGAS
jgi:hypothetical protein